MRKLLLSTLVSLILVAPGYAEPTEAQTGEELFKLHCQTCHGPEGRGDGPAGKVLDPPPRNLTKRPYKQGCGPGAVVHTLQSGLEGTAMPSFAETLSEEEMWKLGRYVRSLQEGGCCQQ